MMVCGSLALMGQSCENSTGDGGGAGTGGDPGTGGNAGAGGTAGTGGSIGASCGADEPCTPGVDNCYDFCSSLCELPESGFCNDDEACICVCAGTEGDCDRTGCTVVECGEPGPDEDAFCAGQGTSLCGTGFRYAQCLGNGLCDIICDSGAASCVSEP